MKKESDKRPSNNLGQILNVTRNLCYLIKGCLFIVSKIEHNMNLNSLHALQTSARSAHATRRILNVAQSE